MTQEAAPFACASCGAPVPIELGAREVTCASCGHRQALPAAIDRELRAHLAAVDSALEEAATEQAAFESPEPREEKKNQLLGFAFFVTLAGMIALAVCAFRNDAEHALLSFWIMLGAWVVVGIFEGTRRLIEANRAPPPPAGVVFCASCGAPNAITATDFKIACASCNTEVLVDADSRKRARRAAEREAEFARAQRAAMRDEP